MSHDPPVQKLLDDLKTSRLLGSVDPAAREDLVQQAASRVIQRFPELSDDARTRLGFVCLRHLILGHQRSVASRARLLRAHAADAERAAPESPDPANAAEEKELRQELRKAVIEALTPEQRAILVRHFLARESMEEIAGATGLSRATVARRIAEAISLLGRAIDVIPETPDSR